MLWCLGDVYLDSEIFNGMFDFGVLAQGIVQNNQNVQGITQVTNAANTMKRPQDNIQPKMAVTRAISILPNGTAAIRPGSSVSTQTTSAVQMSQSMQKAQVCTFQLEQMAVSEREIYLLFLSQAKPRPKLVGRGVNIAAQKSDAGNQTKMQLQQQHVAAGQNK